jgi:hypothetical protein
MDVTVRIAMLLQQQTGSREPRRLPFSMFEVTQERTKMSLEG